MRGLLQSRLFRLVLTSAALGFVAWSVWSLGQRWGQAPISIQPGSIVMAFGAMIVSLILLALAWTTLIRSLAPQPPPLLGLLSVYATSSLGRYMPGKVGQPVMRLAGLAPYGVSARMGTTSILVELASWISTGVGSASMLFAIAGANWEYRTYTTFVGAGCAVVVLALATLNPQRFPATVKRLLVLESTRPLLPLKVILIHMGSWTFWALHGLLLCDALGFDDAAKLARAVAFLVLGPIGGFLALPVPAGLGVRESLMSLGLAPLVGAAGAVAVALLSRAVSLTADVLLWIVAVRIKARRA